MSASHERSGSSDGSKYGGSSRLFGGQERHQVSHLLDARLLVVGDERGDARLRRVRHRAAELFLRHVFTGDGLHDVGAGDEHVRHALHHEDEVGHRGRVDRAAGARPEHHADLRDDARRFDVAEEDAAVRREGHDAFLDARAAAVVEADERCADRLGEIHDLVDLLGVDLAERAAEDREVLGEDEDLAAVDHPPAGDHAVGERPVRSRCRSRGRGAGRACRARRTNPGRAGGRAARGRSACPGRAGAGPPRRARRGAPLP